MYIDDGRIFLEVTYSCLDKMCIENLLVYATGLLNPCLPLYGAF